MHHCPTKENTGEQVTYGYVHRLATWILCANSQTASLIESNAPDQLLSNDINIYINALIEIKKLTQVTYISWVHTIELLSNMVKQ